MYLLKVATNSKTVPGHDSNECRPTFNTVWTPLLRSGTVRILSLAGVDPSPLSEPSVLPEVVSVATLSCSRFRILGSLRELFSFTTLP